MIVVLDTNGIMSDPHMRSTAWKILAHSARDWGVRICTTEVVIMEASAGYARRLSESLVGLQRWEKKHVGILASGDATARLREQIEKESEAYQAVLRAALSSIPVEILPVPEVSHEELVDRAVRRVPPCDANGDGYRDTLNWISMRELVQGDDLVYLVTADTDFTDDDGQLHPTLKKEVSHLDGAAQVTIVESVPAMAVLLAAEFAAVEKDEIKDVQARLRQETLTKFVSSEILRDAGMSKVTARALALPVSTTSLSISELGEIHEPEIVTQASLATDETAVEVSFTADATLLYELPRDAPLGPSDVEVVHASEGGTRLIRSSKRLRIEALVTVDRFDLPLHGELVAVRAPADDPGHQAWRSAATRHYLLNELGRPEIDPEVMESFRRAAALEVPPEVMESLRKATSLEVPPEVMESLRKATSLEVPPEVMESLRKATSLEVPPEVMESLRKATSLEVPPEVMESLRKATSLEVPPEVMESLRKAAAQWSKRPGADEADPTPPNDDSG